MKFLAILCLFGVAIAEPVAALWSKSSGFPEGRIIGGEDTSIEKVPYQVSIGVDGSHHCGGSSIDKNWILTAAHCADQPIDRYTVRTGSTHANAGGSLHKVTHIEIHENYTISPRGIPNNDIALFRIAGPLVIDKTRRTIELYEWNEQIEAGKCANVTGWGTISDSGTISPSNLQTVALPIISQENCSTVYSGLAVIGPGQICAAYPEGGKDACQGDSGGPLVVDDRLAGVVSWGNGCAIPGYPGVYAEVAHYREWIDRSMKAWQKSSSSRLGSSLGSAISMTMVYTLLACLFVSN